MSARVDERSSLVRITPLPNLVANFFAKTRGAFVDGLMQGVLFLTLGIVDLASLFSSGSPSLPGTFTCLASAFANLIFPAPAVVRIL
jgi:hypothetical protein